MRTVEQARTLPMSASVVVHRDELLDGLDRLRAALPEALAGASELLGDREAVVEQGRQEAGRLREQAVAERARLVEQSSVHAEAAQAAQELVAQAQAQAEAVRAEVDDYVDGKLANFEVVLSKTLAAVERGRARLSGHSELDELRGGWAPGPG